MNRLHAAQIATIEHYLSRGHRVLVVRPQGMIHAEAVPSEWSDAEEDRGPYTAVSFHKWGENTAPSTKVQVTIIEDDFETPQP